MRIAVVAAVVLGCLFVTSSADAQVLNSWSSRVYTINIGPANSGPTAGSYPPFGYGGAFPGQVYYGQGTPLQTYAAPYGNPAMGLGGPGYYAPLPYYTNPYYGGFTRYAQYRNRRYGGGHLFNSYFPQYQAETGGVFDR